MAKLGLVFKPRKRRSSATYHIAENFAQGFRKRHGKRRGGAIGLFRLVFTAGSLCLGMAAVFVALHYVPAYLSPAVVLRVSDLDQDVMANRADGALGALAPYWDSLQTRRTYVWAGETIDVQYALENNSGVEIEIRRCASQFVIEVFSCNVESKQKIVLSGKNGLHKLRFDESGFYHFSENLTGNGRVIWRRS